MKTRYIFSFLDEDRYGLFKDMTDDNSQKYVEFLPSHKNFSSPIKYIEKIALSHVVNKMIHIPLQRVFYNLENYDYREDTVYKIIIPTLSIGKLSVSYLRNFKKKYKNVRLYALVTDSMHAHSPHMDFVREKLISDVWDDVLTYDKFDAKEFGFTWFGYTYYSQIAENKRGGVKQSDIYYVGYEKGGREEKLCKLYQFLMKHGISCRFDIVAPKKKDTNIRYLKEKIPYPDVLARVKNSNCILEVLQDGQESQSIRYFEAIIYNKKLLTNNKNIHELPYYNGRYMRYFENLKGIDIDWIRRREEIQYNYKGEFSPLKLIDFLDKLDEKV